MADECRVYWGSHGCDLPRGHDGWHYCGDESGPCSHMSPTGVVEYWDDATRSWGLAVIGHPFGEDYQYA